ncbi:hypothetical protein F5887DRAFT_1137752 [Amanita rubescens]|nr:hypothetical protein F5887DRAFT_1137752 [Amanita rubescens]
MGRKTNKSNKVPNVKLRPAAPGSNVGGGTTTGTGPAGRASLPMMEEESACWAQETQDDAMLDTCPRPFKGVVLCATGIQDKPTLFKQALELGATSTSAFTSRVTHLLAADHGGAKYRCALERQIPVLRPSWITESYQVWLRGDDVDFEESIKNHKLPIFSGVVLSFSGTTNSERQTEITRKLKQDDGTYLENLERPVKITHILCSGDEETAKMRYARRFNQRGEANIHLVWEEWFWDSLEFGGRFNEVEYNVEKPRPQRRMPVVDESPSPHSAMHDSSSKQMPSRVPSAPQYEEEEIACVAHRPAMTVQIWGSLLKNRGYEISNGKVIKSPSKLRKPSVAEPTELNDMDVDAPKTKSIISTFRRANSFAPVNEPSQKSQPSQRLQPFRRTTSVAPVPSQQEETTIPERDVNAEAGPSTIGPRRIFSGLRFRVLGEARSSSVRSAIEQGGGIWASEHDVDDDVDYIIVRLVSGSKLYREEPDELERSKYRTECWLERCLSEQAICPYQDHITFLPLNIQVPIAGTESIIMSFSGLHQDELCWLTRLLRALGIPLANAFSKRTTHLLCPSGTGPKYEKAREWNIPVINREWLAAIATTAAIPSVSEYTVVTPVVPRDRAVEKDFVTVNVKGGGKADNNDVTRRGLRDDDDDFFWAADRADVMMNDITNGRADHAKLTMNDSATRVSRKPSERQMPIPTQRSEPSDTRNLSFGHPKRLLGGSAGPEAQSAAYPTTPSRKIGSAPRHSHFLEGFGLGGEFNAPLHFQLQGEEAMETIAPPIPSSKTPSPMKLPQEGSMPTVLPISPMRIDLALQESVTSLLGKRQGEDEGGRHGKRSRPRRGPMSKQSSASSLNFDIKLASEPDGIYGDLVGKNLDVFDSGTGMEGADANAAEELMDESGAQEKSAWVMYEDPGQVDERKKLMMLLKNSIDDIAVPNVRKKGRRKSARIAAGA